MTTAVWPTLPTKVGNMKLGEQLALKVTVHPPSAAVGATIDPLDVVYLELDITKAIDAGLASAAAFAATWHAMSPTGQMNYTAWLSAEMMLSGADVQSWVNGQLAWAKLSLYSTDTYTGDGGALNFVYTFDVVTNSAPVVWLILGLAAAISAVAVSVAFTAWSVTVSDTVKLAASAGPEFFDTAGDAAATAVGLGGAATILLLVGAFLLLKR